MKISLLISIVVCSIIAVIPEITFSQQQITVSVVRESMSKGTQPGFSVLIPESDLEQVKKDWIKTLQSDTKSKVLEVQHELQIIGANAPQISPRPINIYSILINRDSSVNLIAFYEVDSVFFDPENYVDKLIGEKIGNGIKSYLKKFAVEEYKKSVKKDIEVEEGKLRELEQQVEFYQKDTEKQEKNIKGREQDIRSAEDEITSLEIEKEQKITAIEAQKLSVAGATGETKKIQQGILKDLVRDKKKVDNGISKAKKDIVGYNADIRNYQDAVANNNAEIDKLEEKIFDQEEAISLMETKLSKIK